MTVPRVRRASARDVPGMSRTLARAFEDDSLWSWFIPDARTRRRRLEVMFISFARQLYLRHAEDCYTTDTHDGAALWAPPDHAHMSAMDKLRTLPGWIRAIGPRHLVRARRGIDSIDRIHPHEPHYYLPFVGVAPQSRGRGLGTALVAPVLEKCDRERVGAYLEATSSGSRRCYARLGFEVRSEERLGGDGPIFFPMWREPQLRSDVPSHRGT